MNKFVRALALLLGSAGMVSAAIAAPERWVFDIQDAQTNAVVGSDRVVPGACAQLGL